MTDTLKATVECREAEGQLHAVLVTEGRPADAIPEVFSPGAIQWPATGVAILLTHLGEPETRAFPVRAENGEIRIRATATDAIKQAVAAGQNKMSVEFRALRERRTASGVREIQSAFVDAATLTDKPVYEASTRAEVRARSDAKRPRLGFLWL